jgi:hypothetical protein
MKDEDDFSHLFVYDTKKGMWHKEDDTEAEAFCYCRGNLYFIDRATGQIHMVKADLSKAVLNGYLWEVVTGYIGTDSPDKKYISRLDMRMQLSVGARVDVFAEYDSSGEYEHLCNMVGTDLKSFSIPIKPKRCDHMRLKIQGKGDAKIFSICKTIEGGSSI